MKLRYLLLATAFLMSCAEPKQPMKLGDKSLEELVQRFEQVSHQIKKDPTNAGLLNEQGTLYVSLGHIYDHLSEKESLEKSLQAFYNVIRFAKDDEMIKVGYWHAGETYFFLGDYGKAIQMMEKTIEMFPDDPQTYWHRILINEWAGKQEQNIPDWNKIVELDPARIIGRATALNNMGRYQEAVDDLIEVIKINPKHLFAHMRRAEIYARLGENQKATEDFRKIIELEPFLKEEYEKKIEKLKSK